MAAPRTSANVAPQRQRAPEGQRLQRPQWQLVRAAHRLPLAGRAWRVWIPRYLLAEAKKVGRGGYLGVYLAGLVSHVGRAREASVDQDFPRWQLRAGQKGEGA